MIIITRTGNGTLNFKRISPLYASADSATVTATKFFTPGGNSVVTGMVENDLTINFQVTPTRFTPPADGNEYPVSLQTNYTWQINIPPGVSSWIRRAPGTPAAGTGQRSLKFIVDPNPGQIPRNAEIEIVTTGATPTFRYVVRFSQAGICLPPQATVDAGAEPVCPGDSLQLAAIVNPALQSLYSFRWSNGDTTSIITVVLPAE
ncbi:MAG: BACON domain-containing protein [Saprospiraceae bacterium]|nr:BACON domain-containing protein [Saprospiraceae bacterium]